MDQKQSFSLNSDLLGGYTSIFMKLVFLIIAVYVIVLILNFLRDKFINDAKETRKDNISGLLIILNKLFFVSGFGFVIGNIFQVWFSLLSDRNSGFGGLNLRGDWDYLMFGFILIFIGIGFKVGNRALKNGGIE